MTKPTVASLSMQYDNLPLEEDRHFLVCRDSLWWMVFLSSLHLDHEWITENIRPHTFTYDLLNDKHLFAFSHFSFHKSYGSVTLSLALSHIQQRQWHEMANKIKNEKKNVTQPTLPSLSFAVCQPHEEDSLRWMVFFSSLHLDHEWITENIRVHTLTYDLSNDKHLFAFSHFSE